MKTVGIELIGRFGNKMFQYCFAYAFAEQNRMALQTSAWPGQKIFQLYDEPLNNPDEMISGYHQDQASLIYSREDVRRWFEFRPEIKRRLSFVPTYPLVA